MVVFIVCGDFYLPNVLWSNDETGLIYSSLSDARISCIPECFTFLNFLQLNEIRNTYDTLLDLVFSNERNIVIKRSDILVVPEDSYHPSLVFDVFSSQTVPTFDASHYFPDFKKIDYVKVKTFLVSYNWRDTISALNTNEAPLALSHALNYCVSNFVPLVKYKKSTYPPRFTSDLKRLVIRKKKGHSLFRSTLNPFDYTCFSSLRAQFKYESGRCYQLCDRGCTCKPATSMRMFVRARTAAETQPALCDGYLRRDR